jgi:hypothetical protein
MMLSRDCRVPVWCPAVGLPGSSVEGHFCRGGFRAGVPGAEPGREHVVFDVCSVATVPRSRRGTGDDEDRLIPGIAAPVRTPPAIINGGVLLFVH